MNDQRNPFRLRAAEHIDYDATFLRLFGPGILDLLPQDQLWNKLLQLRSAPGGGKTSLMRLFTPSSLLALHAHRAIPDYQSLYGRLRELGAVDESGPRLLGVKLSCARNYATLADLAMDSSRQERLLFGLLNARIVLAALRGALVLKELAYPDDLSRLQISPPSDFDGLPGLRHVSDGQALHAWAADVEDSICDIIDSFGSPQKGQLLGHESLASLRIIQANAITIDGSPLVHRVLLMLDDVHKLAPNQRERLIETTVDLRSQVGVWMAERLEVLSAEELMSPGATAGRDYDGVVYLEQFWRDRSHPKRFEKTVADIGDRRAQSASDVQIMSFAGCLQPSLEGSDTEQRFTDIRAIVNKRVQERVKSQPQFSSWAADIDAKLSSGTAFQAAIEWRALEIVIERESKRTQKRFDFAVAGDDVEAHTDSGVKAAAELLLAHEFDLPYYFGPARLSAIASSNIEQFLWLASELFEEVVAAAIMRRAHHLSPERQHGILKKAVRDRWSEIPKGVRHGREVRNFLEAIGRFSQWMTYQSNAPYAPGVTGIAISMADLKRLREPANLIANPGQAKLAAIIAAAIANNLLEPVPDSKAKGKIWFVLYLNRMLCVYFGLPLHYGGFKEKTLQELVQWLDAGFVIPSRASRALL